MPLINCKVELKLNCVKTNIVFFLQLVRIIRTIILIIIIFTIKDTKLYVSVVTLYQQETIQNYQNFLAKALKDQFIGMNIKQNVRIKIHQMNIDIFLNQTLLELIDCLH